jgi:hypothetical protein
MVYQNTSLIYRLSVASLSTGFTRKTPSSKKLTVEKEAEIIRALEEMPHASRVSQEIGVSFSTVWRRADRVGIELTAGRAAKGYKRLTAPVRDLVAGLSESKKSPAAVTHGGAMVVTGRAVPTGSCGWRRLRPVARA